MMQHFLDEETVASIRSLKPAGSLLHLILRRGDMAELYRHLFIIKADPDNATEQELAKLPRILKRISMIAGLRGKNYQNDLPSDICHDLKNIFDRLNELNINIYVLKMLVADKNYIGAVKHMDWVVGQKDDHSNQNLEYQAQKFKRLMKDKRVDKTSFIFTDKRDVSEYAGTRRK